VNLKPRVLSHICFRPFHICDLYEMKLCLIVCVRKNSNFEYFPNKIWWADFVWILYRNSSPWRNHIVCAAFEYLLPFCIYWGSGSNFPFFHTLVMASNTAYCTTVHTRDLYVSGQQDRAYKSSFITPEGSKISHKNTKIHKITHTKYDTKLHISTHIHTVVCLLDMSCQTQKFS